MVLLTAALICAFALSPAKAEVTEIELWHALPRENTPLFESLVNEHMKTTCGTIKLNVRRFETPEQLRQQLLEGEKTPDVALIDTRWQNAIHQKKEMIFMEDLIKEIPGYSVYVLFKMDTFKAMWKSSNLNGKLLTLPFTGRNRALILNRDILSRYEIKKTPAVWGDLILIGKKLEGKKRENGDKGKSFAFLLPINESPENVAAFYQVMMWQVEKDIYEPFMGGELVAFDSSEGKAILKMMVDMINLYGISPREEVNKSQVAMFVGTPKDYLELENQGKDLKVVRWPGKKRSANDLVVYAFAVFKGADKKKQEKIWRMLYHLCRFESCLKWSLNTPFLPTNKQVTLVPSWFEYLKKYPGMKIFVQQLKNSRVSLRDRKRQKIMEVLGKNLKLAMKNQISVDAALNSSAQYANMLLDPVGKLRKKKAEMQSLGKYVDKVWNKDY